MANPANTNNIREYAWKKKNYRRNMCFKKLFLSNQESKELNCNNTDKNEIFLPLVTLTTKEEFVHICVLEILLFFSGRSIPSATTTHHTENISFPSPESQTAKKLENRPMANRSINLDVQNLVVDLFANLNEMFAYQKGTRDFQQIKFFWRSCRPPI